MTSSVHAGEDVVGWDAYVARMVGALLTGDSAQARDAVDDALSGGATAADVYVNLIAPALHRVGQAWAHGDINVAEEHRASQICVTIVAQLGDHFRRGPERRGTAVTLTPPDEQHAIASAMVADFLRAAGYDVHHLGAGVPATDLALFLQVVPTELVCFSVTQSLALETYDTLVAACRTHLPHPTIVFGGQGADAHAAQVVDAIIIDSLAELVERIERL